MRRLVLVLTAGLVVLALALVAVVLLVGRGTPFMAASGPAQAGAAAAAISSQPVRTGVDDFTFDSFDVEYLLGLDDGNHATLTTTETLVARFPDYDQNRGIRRSLPATYQGHTTALTIVSVTDENGRPRPFDVEYGAQIVDVIAAVPEGQFVRGPQTYVITYTQRDVVDAFADTGAEEFYWNLTGTDWAQPFARVTGRVVLDDGLAAALMPERLACYRGYSGSPETCPIKLVDDTVSVAADGIEPYQTVTLAIGFAPGTFALFDTSYLASAWAPAQLLSVLGAIAAAIAALVLRLTRYRDARGRPVIIAEYLPPTGLILLDAAVLTKRRKRAVASQLVDFAVRRVITIIEQDAGWFRLRSTWRLRLEAPEGIVGEERSLLTYFFPGLPPGDEHVLRAQNTSLSRSIQAQITRVTEAIVRRGWRSTVALRHSLGITAAAMASGITSFASMVVITDEGRGGLVPGALLLVPAVGFVIVAGSLWRRPLTAEGAEIRDHLRGLDLYIRLAEADRLRVLQSPQGALREPIDVTDPAERLHLYERLLPWAVLFEHEKEWAAVLGEFYDHEPPAWYSGTRPFSVAAFSAGVGAVASTVASSYSGSSSSGGSSGGGSSGGGGGGGGGGGV